MMPPLCHWRPTLRAFVFAVILSSCAAAPAQIPGGAKEMAHVLEVIDSCIAMRERQQASAAAFLQKY